MKLTVPPVIIKFLHQYHLTIFVVIVLGSLAYVIFSLNQTTSQKTPVSTVPQTSSSVPVLDQATMKRIDTLQSNGTPSAPPDLSGRSNPFSE